jgi:hypothetical protein
LILNCEYPASLNCGKSIANTVAVATEAKKGGRQPLAGLNPPLEGRMAHEAVKEQRQLGITAASQLAREIGVSEETVIGAYEAEAARIGHSAAVQQFLHLLAIKHVKAALLARRRSGDTVSSEMNPARRN